MAQAIGTHAMSVSVRGDGGAIPNFRSRLQAESRTYFLMVLICISIHRLTNAYDHH